MNRRKFIRNGLLTAGGLTFLGGFYSWQIEPFWLEITSHKMILKNLPVQLEGKTLMQISDIHVGDRFDYNFIIDGFRKAKIHKPDFVVYTGDYVSANDDEVRYDKLEKVLKHAPTGEIATLGILGNHDYGKNWGSLQVSDRITAMMEAAGVNMLRNKQEIAGGIQFIGFDDYWGLNFDPVAAMTGFQKDLPSIALCHNPDVCDLDTWHEFTGWILAGHTHGGQVKPPFLPPPMLPVKNKRYTSGIIKLDDRKILFINRALGHLWQVRFNVRPEITLFSLASV